MNKSQIEIYKNTLDKIANKIKQNMTKEELQEAISLQEIKKSAKIFILIIDNFKNSVFNFENKLKRMKELRHQFINNTYKVLPEYINLQKSVSTFLNSYKPDMIYKSTISFQTILNSKLGQRLKSIIVFENEQGNPIIAQFHIKDSLKYSYSSSAKMNASINLLKQSRDALKIIQQNGLKDTQAQYLQFLYKDMNTRYDIGKQTGSNRIMWLNPSPPPKWKKRKIQSKGSINEAYAALILERRYKGFFTDYRVDVDKFMENEIDRVDNISGVLQGDAEYQNIQYCIKSLNASFMGLNDIITIARKITTEKTSLLKQLLEEAKQSLAKRGAKINSVAESSLQKHISKDMIKYEKQQYKIAMDILK